MEENRKFGKLTLVGGDIYRADSLPMEKELEDEFNVVWRIDVAAMLSGIGPTFIPCGDDRLKMKENERVNARVMKVIRQVMDVDSITHDLKENRTYVIDSDGQTRIDYDELSIPVRLLCNVDFIVRYMMRVDDVLVIERPESMVGPGEISHLGVLICELAKNGVNVASYTNSAELYKAVYWSSEEKRKPLTDDVAVYEATGFNRGSGEYSVSRVVEWYDPMRSGGEIKTAYFEIVEQNKKTLDDEIHGGMDVDMRFFRWVYHGTNHPALGLLGKAAVLYLIVEAVARLMGA